MSNKQSTNKLTNTDICDENKQNHKLSLVSMCQSNYLLGTHQSSLSERYDNNSEWNRYAGDALIYNAVTE